MENEKSEKSMFDVAALISVIGIFLYVLGYLYLRNYYKVLQVSSSFLDLSLNNVLVKTWPLILVTILGFVPVFFQVFIKNHGVKQLPLAETIIYLFASILLLPVGMWFLGRTSWRDTLIAFILMFPLVFLNVYLGNRITSVKTVEKVLYKYFLLCIFPLASMLIYSYKGQAYGEKIKAEYEDDVEITLNHDNQKINGKYLLFSNNKYIVMIENNNCEKETFIINNEDVSYIRFISTAVYK